jgi:hypothetical protein
MSVVMGVVRGHKGAILVSSQPEQGTRISVLFPAGPTRTPVILPTRTPPATAGVALPALTGTVLVVEDERGIEFVAQ